MIIQYSRHEWDAYSPETEEMQLLSHYYYPFYDQLKNGQQW